MDAGAPPPLSHPGPLVRPPRLLGALLRPATDRWRILAGAVVAIAVLTVAGHGLVLYGGGTKFSGTFALLLPVMLAASVFQVPGGVVMGAVAGLVLGPAMPLDVAAEIPQPTQNWLIRLGWFVALGGFVGVLTGVPRWRNAVRDHRVRVDEMSGLPTPDAVRLAASRPDAGYAVAVDFGMYERLLDTHGRDVANAFVRAVSGCLLDALGDPGAGQAIPLTRVRSDVFGLLLPNRTEMVTRTVEAILGGLPRWITLDGVGEGDGEPLIVPVTAHVGVAELTALDLDDFDAFRNGIRAARVARETRRRVTRYDRSSTPVARENVQMAAELLQAIERDELYLEFQPKLRLRDGAVPAAEALLRWRSPRRGPVPPARFIPVAEQSSLINMLTEWVLDRAAGVLEDWRSEGRSLRLSVNLSGRDLMDEHVFELVRDLPERRGLDARAFSLEVTETAFIDELGPIAERLEELRAEGYDILVDDFGTGCSSFAYLHRLPVDGVKIDRTFIAALRSDPTAAQLVGSMLDWCRTIGKRTIAEGVEDVETAVMLQHMGCDEIQGYWLSRPLPASGLLQWLDDGTAAARSDAVRADSVRADGGRDG